MYGVQYIVDITQGSHRLPQSYDTSFVRSAHFARRMHTRRDTTALNYTFKHQHFAHTFLHHCARSHCHRNLRVRLGLIDRPPDRPTDRANERTAPSFSPLAGCYSCVPNHFAAVSQDQVVCCCCCRLRLYAHFCVFVCLSGVQSEILAQYNFICATAMCVVAFCVAVSVRAVGRAICAEKH